MPRSPKSPTPLSRPPPIAITARLVVRRVKDARLPRRAVPGLAVSPVLHQHRPARRAGRHHPPPTRHHRNRVRRPDRRTAGTSARRDASAPTPPGSCARRSPTTCCAPPASSPGTSTPGHEDRRCAAGSSTSRPDWPARNADRSCTYPPTGPGRNTGLRLWHNTIGLQPTTIRATLINPADRPNRSNTGKAGQTSRYLHAHTRKSRSAQPRTTHHRPIGGSRLRAGAWGTPPTARGRGA